LGDQNVVIFTDACYERTDNFWPCGLGGVLCVDGEVQFFSLPVNAAGRTVLGELEAETLSAVLAFMLWKGRLSTNK
jgi:hypothetical protein